MAKLDRQADFSLDGKPSSGGVSNKFEGTGNPNPFPPQDLDPALAPDRSLSKDKGSDTAGEFAGGDFAG